MENCKYCANDLGQNYDWFHQSSPICISLWRCLKSPATSLINHCFSVICNLILSNVHPDEKTCPSHWEKTCGKNLINPSTNAHCSFASAGWWHITFQHVKIGFFDILLLKDFWTDHKTQLTCSAIILVQYINNSAPILATSLMCFFNITILWIIIIKIIYVWWHSLEWSKNDHIFITIITLIFIIIHIICMLASKGLA